MRMMLRLRLNLLLGVACCLLVVACSPSSGPTPKSSPVATASSLLDADPPPVGWTERYTHLLESPEQGDWHTFENEGGSGLFEQGGLRLYVGKASTRALTAPVGHRVDGDARVEATVKRVDGLVDKGFYGLVCRDVSGGPGQYYASIGSDGFFSIQKTRPSGEEQPLVNLNGEEKAKAIKQGLGVNNRLAFECLGHDPTRLILYVNGDKVAETEDSEPALQKATLGVGIRADAGVSPPTDVIFNSFVIYSRG